MGGVLPPSTMILLRERYGEQMVRAVFDCMDGISSFDFAANAATLRTNGLLTRTLNRNPL